MRNIERRLKSNSFALAVIFSLSIALILMIHAFTSRANKVTEHNVIIYHQLGNGDWVMSSDEEESIVFRPCADDITNGVDVDGILRQASADENAGNAYIADKASWEERGTCKSILSPDLGFEFRNKHNNFTYRRVQK